MSFFVAANNKTQEILETGKRNLDISGSVETAFREALCTNYSINDADLELRVFPDDINAVSRVMAGDEYELQWTGESITGIDFTPENNKRWLKCYSTKGDFDADGIDDILITIEIWDKDKQNIDPVTETIIIPIKTPNGNRSLKVDFVNGVYSKIFKTTNSGNYTIPSGKFGNFRILETCLFEAIATLDVL